MYFGRPVQYFLSRITCLGWPVRLPSLSRPVPTVVLAILWLSCHGWPVPVFLSNGCSLSVVLPQLYWLGISASMFLSQSSCPCCRVLAISCPLCPAQADLPGLPVPDVLSSYPVPDLLSRWSCPSCPVHAVTFGCNILFSLSCLSYPVPSSCPIFTVIFTLSGLGYL